MRNSYYLSGKVVSIIAMVIVSLGFTGCKKQTNTWYVEPELEHAWARVIREAGPPETFPQIQVWEGPELPAGPGVLIASKPWKTEEMVTVYNRLPFSREYHGAILLALDPWMVFLRYQNPQLTAGRAYSDAGGDGLLLLPGRDPESVMAWTTRLVQESPGIFPSDEQAWLNQERSLFNGRRFVQGAQTYTWQDVFFRLMGSEPAWVYAPLSAIRRYNNPRKSILVASAFPEREDGPYYSLQAALLWALPVGSDAEKEKLADTIEWLKKAETQTAVANAIDWIPADPYGTPYDPVSLASHRNWLTASFVYEINR